MTDTLEQPGALPVEKLGSRPGRRNVRIVIEGPSVLKQRLETFSFETGIPVAELGRYALWEAILEAEGNPKKFCQKVAARKLRHREEERVR